MPDEQSDEQKENGRSIPLDGARAILTTQNMLQNAQDI
jgi:hypothetical protein